MEACGAGKRSSVGVKRMITARLNKLANTDSKADREDLIEEINDLVLRLYTRYKASQQNLEQVRDIINS